MGNYGDSTVQNFIDDACEAEEHFELDELELFAKRRREQANRRKRKNCDQCEAVMINGVFCHEHGCPNN